MIRNSQKIVYVLISLFILTSFNIIQLNHQNSDNSINNIDNIESKPETSDIIPLPFIVGVPGSPFVIDPVNSLDFASWNIIDQVCEGLFKTNLTDPELPRVNWLAESYWWEHKTTLHLKLREDILFHDGTPFNSTAVKWNLERINYLTNATGTLPIHMDVARSAFLWKIPNGTSIMKNIEIINEYNITIYLNGAYSPFLNLLSSTMASMVSPSSHSQTDYIDNSEDLVGTGPFEYDNYLTDVELNFHAFDSYWRGIANISEMKYSIISNNTERHNAMLNGQIDYLYQPNYSLFPTFEADPDIVVAEAPTSGLQYNYLGMNNKRINITWRKAISYAINYSFIIEELYDNRGTWAHSPISSGFGDAFYNCSEIAPYYNVTIARQTLIDAGVTSLAVDDDMGWEAANLATLNYSYNVDNQFRVDLYPFLIDCLDKIGIWLVDDGTDYITYLNKLFYNQDQLSLFWIGWGLDYFDPDNIFWPLMHSSSIENMAQVNDAWLDSKVEEGRGTVGESARNTIYHDIQIYLASTLYPHAFGFHPRVFFVYNVNLTNFPHNSLRRLYFFPCKWIPKYIETPPAGEGIIFIDDADPNYNWSKTALENDWCSGTGTWDDPYIIQDIIIDGENTKNCIRIQNSTAFFEIRNCTLYNGSPHGIHIINTDNSFISNNTIYDIGMVGMGMWLENSDNHTIFDNRIWNITSGFGIYLMMGSDHCKILNNSIKSSIGGIGTVFNFDNLILGNTVNDNSMGIGVGLAYNITVEHNDAINNAMAGIVLQEANDTIVKNNLVTDNLNFGIYSVGGHFGIGSGCYNNRIIHNQIYNNMILGLSLDNYTVQNEIFLNEFIGNFLNAEDNGTLNMWDNGVIGNSWDDYVGFDINDDGIGDLPYLVNGTAGSLDNYPIYDDGPDDPPEIIINLPIDDQGYADIAPNFILIITPEYDTIWYTLDNGIKNITCGTIDQINGTLWDGLDDNIYTLRFYANRSNGLIGTAEVSIYKDTTDPIITINDPDPGEGFTGTIPDYNITITELHLASVWYTMDFGVTTIQITGIYTGTIDEDEWNALPDGQVTIIFYALDDQGNIGFASVMVNKNSPTTTPDIPGPFPILVIMILLAGIIGLTWRHKYKLK